MPDPFKLRDLRDEIVLTSSYDYPSNAFYLWKIVSFPVEFQREHWHISWFKCVFYQYSEIIAIAEIEDGV